MDLGRAVEKLRAGDRRTVARLISLVEDESPRLSEVVQAVMPHARGTFVVAFTGSPGVGKSTLAATLIRVIREEGKTVAVLAIDPTSPFTGGALLGDRLRMQDHATDGGVYIRSMATRGRLGGLAWATPHALRILDAAGFEVIILETVGVGQAEVEVANSADTTVVVLAPGLGDSVQANKAGLLEIGNIYCVNKADREGAGTVVRDLRQMLDLGVPRPWRPPVLAVSAETGSGIEELWSEIRRHRAHLEESDELRARRRERVAREIAEVAVARVREAMGEIGEGALLDELATEVLEGRLDPYTAADKLVARVT